MEVNHHQESLIDPAYSGGDYFQDPHRHSEDAQFKSEEFLKLFLKSKKKFTFEITSCADVGCGAGNSIQIISAGLKKICPLKTVKAFDVSPHVRELHMEDVEFVHGDFCLSAEEFDLVTLFDVFEHIPDPTSFIKAVALRAKLIGFHIPLDYSLNMALRNMFKSKLVNPGHLLFLDVVSALNLLTHCGLRVIDYEYTFGFLAPSNRSLLQRLAFPFRLLLAKTSPWVLSKVLGGASLIVLALTPKGMKERSLEQIPMHPASH